MKPCAYDILQKNANEHWWNKSKEAILLDLVKSLKIPKEATALELGVGTGLLLSKLGVSKKIGMDFHLFVNANYKDFSFVQGDVNNLPFKEESIDLLLAVDLLEHVENDALITEKCLRILKKNGKFVIFVPAFRILWSRLDEVALHFRRYRAKDIETMLRQTGIKHRIIKHSYLNFLLFMPIFFVRMIQRMLKPKYRQLDATGLKIPNKFINNCLQKIFSSERFLLRFINCPFGTSYLCIVEKQ